LFRRPKFTLSCSSEGKEGKKEGRKEGRKKERKEGRKEGKSPVDFLS
jgi:predicted transposase YdaD